MKERKLVYWALVASLLIHFGFMVYSGRIRIDLGPSPENLELFQFDLVDSLPPELGMRAIKREVMPDPSQVPRDRDTLPRPRVGAARPDAAPTPNLPGPARDAQPTPAAVEAPEAPLPVMTVEGRAEERLRDWLAGESSSAPADRATPVDKTGPRVVQAPAGGAPPPPVAKSALPAADLSAVGAPRGGPTRQDAVKLEPPRLRPPREQRPSLAPAELAALDRRNYENIEAFLDFKLETYHNPRGEGFFRITIVPNQRALALPVLRKDVVFCLDASRSIGPLTFRELTKGVNTCIARLRPEDRFNLVGFETKDTRFVDGLAPATPAAKEAAIALLSRFRAEGLTNIYSALVPISQIGGGYNHPFIVLLFSDGRANRGVLDSSKIINDMTENIKVNSSIFALGVGGRVNEYLLDLLTMRNKGRSFFAPETVQVAYEVRKLFDRIADPLMINVDYRFSGEVGERVYPGRLPDLYRNGDLVLVGRMGSEKGVTLGISGQFTDVRRHAVFTRDYPGQDNGGPEIERQYGYYAMYEVIERICRQGRDPVLLSELDRVSRQYGVAKPDYAEFR